MRCLSAIPVSVDQSGMWMGALAARHARRPPAATRRAGSPWSAVHPLRVRIGSLPQYSTIGVSRSGIAPRCRAQGALGGAPRLGHGPRTRDPRDGRSRGAGAGRSRGWWQRRFPGCVYLRCVDEGEESGLWRLIGGPPCGRVVRRARNRAPQGLRMESPAPSSTSRVTTSSIDSTLRGSVPQRSLQRPSVRDTGRRCSRWAGGRPAHRSGRAVRTGRKTLDLLRDSADGSDRAVLVDASGENSV